MITQEEANKFLSAHELTPADKKERADRCRQLPESQQRLALLVLNLLPEYHQKDDNSKNYYKLQEQREAEMEKLLSVKNPWTTHYPDVLPTLFGDLAPSIINGWNLHTALMYQTGYYRRSFRAPQRPQLYRTQQIHWFQHICTHLKYKFDLSTYARYMGYIVGYYGQQTFAYLLAGALSKGDDTGKAVFQTLLDTILDRDNIARVTRPAIKALLIHHDPAGWEAVTKLLLAAQRQEGLRQTILECLDETHLNAQIHLMEVILEHNLLRFSAVIRALDVWIGLAWEAAKPATLKRALTFGLQFLKQPETVEKAIQSKDNLEVMLALWATACRDVDETIHWVKVLLNHKHPEKQMLGLYFLAQTQLYDLQQQLAQPFLNSENFDLVSFAIKNVQHSEKNQSLFNTLIALWQRVPAKGYQSSGKVFKWWHVHLTRENIMNVAIDVADEEIILELLPIFSDLALSNRERLARWLLDEDNKTDSPQVRQLAFVALADRGEWVRKKAFAAIKKMTLQASEVEGVEALLTRKSADLRRGIIELLYQLKEADILASAKRLMEAKNQEQRLAGLDLLTRLKKKKRANTAIVQLVEQYQTRKKIGAKEQILIDQLLKTESAYTIENGYGIYDPTKLTSIPDPVHRLTPDALQKWFPSLYKKDKADNIYSIDNQIINQHLNALLDLIETHKNHEYEVLYQDGTKTQVLVGNSVQQRRYWSREELPNIPAEDRFRTLPLAEIWEKWYMDTGMNRYELTVVNALLQNRDNYRYNSLPKFSQQLLGSVIPPLQLKSEDWNQINSIARLLDLLTNWQQPEHFATFCLDIHESFYASISTEQLNATFEKYNDKETWRDIYEINYWLQKVNVKQLLDQPSQVRRLWELQQWKYSSATLKKDDYKASLYTHLVAFAKKENAASSIINEHDLAEKILFSPNSLRDLTNKKRSESVLPFITPTVENLLQKCVYRIVEIETQRGDSSTEFSDAAMAIQRVEGLVHLRRILQALSKEKLHRGYSYYSATSKKEVLSHLLKVCHPAQTDTQEQFKQICKDLKISDERLVEVAMYAPQWLPMIQTQLGWKGLTEGCWWLHAHTKEYGYAVEQKWEADINFYTPLQARDLVDGAVDVDWFKSAYAQLKKTRWAMLYKAAKYISDGQGHRRAQIFSDAMLGQFKMREVTKTIKEKRRQDYVRALGLLPVNKRNAEGDLLKRYQLLQQFLKESKQFGAQKQTSEKLAVRIGMDNLARTAGYSDPIRLTWAMEAKTAQQILAQAKPVIVDETTISLVIDDLGKAHLIVKKGDKTLKSIPAKLRKNKAVVQLKTFQKTLRDQYSRTRKALEEAMCRGDLFTSTEITDLFKHPVVRPLLEQLVLVVDNAEATAIGYFQEGLLLVPEQDAYPIKAEQQLRLAHCIDLYQSGYWSALQRDCFTQKRVQPFKQIFRELYLPTSDELAEGTISRRYAGHQVQPQKTVALLKNRGWTVSYDEGLRRVYHQENLVVHLYAQADWFTPADIEHPTLETLHFSRRNDYQKVPFTEISPRIFSEVMRDMDLVVSVAHAGGVDPEASHSTIEMRSVMVEETARLLGFSNLNLKKSHVIIKGELGDYSLHLGSGTVHKMPGGYLSILPVHSQHRGRIFLPFADDDPKTAEILSKILLLAEDGKIKDPTVLRQM